MATPQLSDTVVQKLEILKNKLHTDDLEKALDKSLNIANFIADTVNSPESKLLVERNGKYLELKEIA